MIVRQTLRAGLVALACSACASSGAVPRPFPGAELPPRTGQPVQTQAPSPPQPAVETPDSTRAALVATALGLRGVPYRNGGSDPSGFDCSGFVQWIFAQHATQLPRETQEQYHFGNAIAMDRIQPGDLVFFETVSKGASHVGVAIGGDQFIHAPSSRGVVRIERYTAAYWSVRFIGARRVISSQTGTQ